VAAPRTPGALLHLPGGGYVYTLSDEGVRFEVRHLRRQYHQLHGELDVRVDWQRAAPTVNGSLSCADLNLSSQRERTSRAEYCAKRAGEHALDWYWAIDTVCQLVIQAERQTGSVITLDDAPADAPPDDFHVFGLSIPSDSHSQIICDGGGLKSLILLLILGTLAAMDVPVLFLDWEWNATRHLGRKRRLFGDERLDHLHYLRCRNPLTTEADHIRRVCDAHKIEFVGLDSISAAVDGKLADDDVARAYNRALDGLPPSLAAAHIPKTSGQDNTAAESKAFGSAFFHNFARCSWSLKKEIGANPDLVTVVLTPQKQNDGGRHTPVALEFTFRPQAIHVRNVDATNVQTYARTLAIHERIARLLTGGAMTITAIAQQLDAKPDSVAKALKRGLGERFVLVPGEDRIDRYALLDRWVA
jgi:hypothetical protein